ncbi:hypothetical protein NQZ68_022187 [Dissostichus eleginoides]|nr:hypothetical protein NQZ68_022187 [Dissostichus eleginoides]
MAADPGSDSLSVPLTTETDTEFTLFLTPVSSDLTPAISSDLTPALSSDLTPALSSDLTPALSSHLTPALSSDLTPALSSDLTPALSSGLTPALSSDLTPALSSDLTPPVSSVSSSQKRRPTRNKVAINECPIHQGSATFPYKKLLRERIMESHTEVLVQWQSCSGWYVSNLKFPSV